MLNIENNSDSDESIDIDSYEFDETADNNNFDQLPHFANDENKKLHALLKEKEEHLLKLTSNVEENKNRISIMSEHMKNVENELSHSRQILLAKQNEIKTEKHLSLLAQKEKHRLKSDNKKSEQEIMEYQNRLNNIHNEIFQVNEKIESFKLKMNWKNEELQQWTLAAKQKEEDQIALEKYKRSDELKIKNLNIELEVVSNQAKLAKNELDKEITETKAVQVELDNTATTFKQLHHDRIDIITKWDESVKNIHAKDEEVIEMAKEVETLKGIVTDHDIELENKKSILNGQLAEKKNIERNIDKLTRNLEKLRKENIKYQGMVKDDTNEIMLMESEISKIEGENKVILLNINNLQEMNNGYVEKIEDKKEKLKQKIRELSDAKQNLFATEKETNDIDHLLNEHELRLTQIIKLENNLKKDLFKQQSLLFELNKEQQTIQGEIKGTTATTKNLLSKIEELDKRSLKQNENLYSLDFQIQQLERKVSRASGKRTREEQIELNEKIAQLTAKLEGQKNLEKDLTNQVKKFSDDLRKAKKQSIDVVQRKKLLEDKINEINLENQSIEEEILNLDKMKNELYVTHDEEKLNVNKIKGQLTEITDKVFLLENKKVELNMILQKQLNEIEQINKINSTELKNKQNILHSTKMEYTKCQQKINTLRAKYATLSARIRGSSDDGDDKEKSQVYIMIKMAQTKQELIDRGNTLDVEIRKSEKELKLLYKSLRHLNHGNALYRQSLHSTSTTDLTEEDQELEQIKMELTNKYRKISNSLHQKREMLKQLKGNIDNNESRMRMLTQQCQQMEIHIGKYMENDEKLNKKLEKQKEKLQRAVKDLEKYKKNMNVDVDGNKLLMLKDVRRKEKSIIEMIKYLDDILQQNNVHIDGLEEIRSYYGNENDSMRMIRKSGRRSGSVSSSMSVVSESSSRPSTTSTNVSSAMSIVSLSPQF